MGLSPFLLFMNILFIYEVDYLNKVVFDMHMLAESMSLRWHNIYAIDYESTWKRGEKKQKELDVARVFEKAKVHLIRPNFIRIPIISRISAFISHYYAIKKVIKEKKIGVIVLYSVPTNGLQAVRLAKKYKIQIIFRSLDVLHQLVKNPILRIVTKKMERLVYSKVDLGLTITPKLSEYMENLGCKKTVVLNMPVDTDKFYPFKSEIGKQWGINGKDKVILFMGTLFSFTGLELFIAMYNEILREVPNAKLLVVGDGEQKQNLERIVLENGFQDVVKIIGRQHYSDMPEYINLADVCINPFEINEITKDIFPGKIVQYLACGKPLVCTRLQGVKKLIEGENKGVVYADDGEGIVKATIELLKNQDKRELIGKCGHVYTIRNHSCVKVAEKLEAIINGVEHGRI